MNCAIILARAAGRKTRTQFSLRYLLIDCEKKNVNCCQNANLGGVGTIHRLRWASLGSVGDDSIYFKFVKDVKEKKKPTTKNRPKIINQFGNEFASFPQ